MKRQSDGKKTFFWTAQSQRPLKFDLRKAGEKLHLTGAFLAKDKEAFTIEVEVNHLAPHTESKITVRGIVTGNASGNFHGKVLIKKGAAGARAALEEKSLLLSDQARSEVIPALEIDENDVQATHSTYVGKLDEEEIFYLRSRGILEKAAKTILLRAFLWPVLSTFEKNQQRKIEKGIKNLG